MPRSIPPGVCFAAFCVLIAFANLAAADEMWIAPTLQQDTGGFGIGSNVFWPVTVVGATRFAWGVPDDLQAFQAAKIALIPHAPGGAATLNVIVCAAQSGQPVAGSCSGLSAHPFTGVPNQLIEVDISADLAPKVGAAGLNNLAVVAFTTPTTTTDHVAGLRFIYSGKLPAGAATLGANTFAGIQTAPAFAGDGTNVSNVNANLLDGLDSTAFALSAHTHNVTQITNAARLAGGNTFTGTQAVDSGNLDLDPSTAATGVITKNGTRFIHNIGSGNTFVGESAGNLTMTGGNNTGLGANSLSNDTTGNSNTAVGHLALRLNDVGTANTAMGRFALSSNLSGLSNTAIGTGALQNNDVGGSNTAVGLNALSNSVSGSDNVAIGKGAGEGLTTGSDNIYLGADILASVFNESNTMRLGRAGSQLRAFIAGVRGVTTGNANAVPVLIDSSGQLGTVSSSRRFKEDIRDMGDVSRRLYDLRPVTFRYTQAYRDGSKPINYGLVAEEVADVFPELAARGADGAIETVHYETLNVLLLNEVQRQQQELSEARRRIDALEKQLGGLLAALPTAAR